MKHFTKKLVGIVLLQLKLERASVHYTYKPLLVVSC